MVSNIQMLTNYDRYNTWYHGIINYSGGQGTGLHRRQLFGRIRRTLPGGIQP